MKKLYNNSELFEKTLSIVTKTISKKKKIEINYVNEESSFNNESINIKKTSSKSIKN